VQAKKLKTEARLKTLQRLAALAPTTSTSASLLSSSTLGQNPLAPTSAKERLEQREDRLVRRGIERMQRRGLAGDSDEDGESGSEHVSEEEGMSARRKGKERAVEVVEDVGGLMLAASEGATLAAHAVSKNAKPKKSKKVRLLYYPRGEWSS
jgi:ATP-dependent RNA helicase DHX37/DHR1